MPTKSNNKGGRGGARPGAGRKKKATIDKAAAGNPGGRALEVMDLPELECNDMPEPHAFINSEQRDGTRLLSSSIYKDTWNWLVKVGCENLVSPDLIERYAMSYARYIQCEEMISRAGPLAKHPTTGSPIPSPFVNIGIMFQNQADRFWNEIYQIVKENCRTDFRSIKNPQDDMMEMLLGGKS